MQHLTWKFLSYLLNIQNRNMGFLFWISLFYQLIHYFVFVSHVGCFFICFMIKLPVPLFMKLVIHLKVQNICFSWHFTHLFTVFPIAKQSVSFVFQLSWKSVFLFLWFLALTIIRDIDPWIKGNITFSFCPVDSSKRFIPFIVLTSQESEGRVGLQEMRLQWKKRCSLETCLLQN